MVSLSSHILRRALDAELIYVNFDPTCVGFIPVDSRIKKG